MAISRPFRVQAPGRVCLFGEHSDYLGLDVLPAAINLNIEIIANPRDDDLICINYMDIGDRDEFSLNTLLTPRHKRDYLRSAFNVVRDLNYIPSHGWDFRVSGNIPLAAGLSSSSALSVASVVAATHIAGHEFNRLDLARYAYETEVSRFGESGGMMDHFASSFGGIIHVTMTSEQRVTQLPAVLEGLIIGDSCQKKQDTVGDLREIRKSIETGFRMIESRLPDFDRRATSFDSVSDVLRPRATQSALMAQGALRNRDLTSRAFELLRKRNPDEQEIGVLLNEHHEILRDELHRSTPKIEKMIKTAIEAGALGCKINGSGGGGTMLAYAPGQEQHVLQAIRDSEGVPYSIEIGKGASLTILRE